MFNTRTTLFAGLLLGAAVSFLNPATANANGNEQHETPAADYMHYGCFVNQQLVANYMLTPEADARASVVDRQRYCSMAEVGHPGLVGGYFVDSFINDPMPQPPICLQRHYKRVFLAPMQDPQGNDATLVETRTCSVDTQPAFSQVNNEPFCQSIVPSEHCVVVGIRFEGPDFGDIGGVDDDGGGVGCKSDMDCGVGQHCHENQGPNGTCADDGT